MGRNLPAILLRALLKEAENLRLVESDFVIGEPDEWQPAIFRQLETPPPRIAKQGIDFARHEQRHARTIRRENGCGSGY
jgi:hypothetical protein